MDIGTIENYDWTLWDGSQKYPERLLLHQGISRLIDAPMAGRLSRVVQQLQLIDEDFRLELKEQLALNYLYSICEIGQELQEQLIVICDVRMDPIVLRPLIRRLETQNKTGLPICLILTEMHLDGVVSYKYEPTEDAYRNLVIALTSLKERREFEQKSLMFDNIRPTHLKQIATYVKGLTRKGSDPTFGWIDIGEGKYQSRSSSGVHKILSAEAEEINWPPKTKSAQTKKEVDNWATLLQSERGIHGHWRSKWLHEWWTWRKPEYRSNRWKWFAIFILERVGTIGQLGSTQGENVHPSSKRVRFCRLSQRPAPHRCPWLWKNDGKKIISEEWDMKLHRINPDDITSKFVGGSEENMRSVLDKLVEDAPSICFVDEAEKLFVQMNSEIQNVRPWALIARRVFCFNSWRKWRTCILHLHC